MHSVNETKSRQENDKRSIFPNRSPTSDTVFRNIEKRAIRISNDGNGGDDGGGDGEALCLLLLCA